MQILGISCLYHDAAAALLRDGDLVAAAHEERFTRMKNDPRYPQHAIRFCLERAGISDPRELDWVVFYERPLLKFERILTTALLGFPRTLSAFRESMLTWLGEKLWIKERIASDLRIPTERILFSTHHLSHAASAFYCSPFERAAVLTADAVGEWTTTMCARGDGTTLEPFAEIRFPDSLGMLYSAFTAFLGFEVNEGEYKVMGLAAYGTPRYADRIRDLVRVGEDGSFALEMGAFEFHRSTTRMYGRRLEDLFGPPRLPEAPVSARDADLAASIQVVLEELLLGVVRSLYATTGLDDLCLAGGVALNSVANARLLLETPFRRLFVQPAAGDAGGALGAALWAYHAVLGQPRRFRMEHAYWGRSFRDSTIADALRSCGADFEEVRSEDELVDRVVHELLDGRIVAWHQGRSEWGPRALGARSILADPREVRMKDIINAKIKYREPFRPFAPSVTEDEADRYFVFDRERMWAPARFMLLVVPVRDEARDKLGAVTHVDGSARLQTVPADVSPLYHRLIARFGMATGVPVVLNTSFNVRGEPIVDTPEDALATFYRTDLDVLAIDRFLVRKTPTA